MEEENEKEGAETLGGSDVRRESVVEAMETAHTEKFAIMHRVTSATACDAAGACDLLDAPRPVPTAQGHTRKALGRNTEYGGPARATRAGG